jgi:hypothetical protein
MINHWKPENTCRGLKKQGWTVGMALYDRSAKLKFGMEISRNGSGETARHHWCFGTRPVALHFNIISPGLIEQVDDEKMEKKFCPRCGKEMQGKL